MPGLDFGYWGFLVLVVGKDRRTEGEEWEGYSFLSAISSTRNESPESKRDKVGIYIIPFNTNTGSTAPPPLFFFPPAVPALGKEK